MCVVEQGGEGNVAGVGGGREWEGEGSTGWGGKMKMAQDLVKGRVRGRRNIKKGRDGNDNGKSRKRENEAV